MHNLLCWHNVFLQFALFVLFASEHFFCVQIQMTRADGIPVGQCSWLVPNIENFKIGLKLCLIFNNTHDKCDTVSDIFHPYLRDLLAKF